jgi:hypothetical protein
MDETLLSFLATVRRSFFIAGAVLFTPSRVLAVLAVHARLLARVFLVTGFSVTGFLATDFFLLGTARLRRLPPGPPRVGWR